MIHVSGRVVSEYNLETDSSVINLGVVCSVNEGGMLTRTSASNIDSDDMSAGEPRIDGTG